MSNLIPGDMGRIRIITPSNPVLAAEISITQEVSLRWMFVGFLYTLAAGAAGNPRVSDVVFEVGGVEVIRLAPVESIAATETRTFQWRRGTKQTVLSSDDMNTNNIGQDLVLNNEVTIRTETSNFAPNGQYSDIVLIVEEWIEPLS
ncbi:hypothetical protein LCGC14_2138130 [marine sediment metagenome]|uniref:Uncharacterized protein n=1 Tax=marine sediment metagenome TaxID=412755 RepID=A0A0F9DZ88_9ZZZZ